MARGKYIQKRPDGGFRFVLRVPVDLRAQVGRDYIRHALNTSDEATAIIKARDMAAEIRAGWDALRDGQQDDQAARFDAALRIARRHGFDYRTRDDLVATADTRDLQARLAAATQSPHSAPALLGLVDPPELMMSGLVDEVARLQQFELSRKSPKQMHRWRLARVRAARNFINLCGDIAVHKITRDQALDFQDWWQRRLLEEGLKPASLNSDLGNLSSMIERYRRARRLTFDNVFKGLLIKDTVQPHRHALTADEIAAHLLPALPRINDEAGAIVQILANTGLRPSEVCNLRPEDIIIDHAIPHVSIAFREDREIKTPQAARRVPLVGIALAAARAFPRGFPRYHDKEASFSATAGKWMRAAMPGVTGVSSYSFRHGFQDRLNRLAPSERANADLMGHAITRERYGDGVGLETLAEIMRAVSVA